MLQVRLQQLVRRVRVVVVRVEQVDCQRRQVHEGGGREHRRADRLRREDAMQLAAALPAEQAKLLTKLGALRVRQRSLLRRFERSDLGIGT